jgi:hypothetical protein
MWHMDAHGNIFLHEVDAYIIKVLHGRLIFLQVCVPLKLERGAKRKIVPHLVRFGFQQFNVMKHRHCVVSREEADAQNDAVCAFPRRVEQVVTVLRSFWVHSRDAAQLVHIVPIWILQRLLHSQRIEVDEAGVNYRAMHNLRLLLPLQLLLQGKDEGICSSFTLPSCIMQPSIVL